MWLRSNLKCICIHLLELLWRRLGNIMKLTFGVGKVILASCQVCAGACRFKVLSSNHRRRHFVESWLCILWSHADSILHRHIIYLSVQCLLSFYLFSRSLHRHRTRRPFFILSICKLLFSLLLGSRLLDDFLSLFGFVLLKVVSAHCGVDGVWSSWPLIPWIRATVFHFNIVIGQITYILNSQALHSIPGWTFVSWVSNVSRLSWEDNVCISIFSTLDFWLRILRDSLNLSWLFSLVFHNNSKSINIS